ncbi:uncharacterized protein M421DRAFT_420756 [Didymella exigua CBS 183.55]|uniref:Chromo domain-containing protein n=1 Tax=Didymella exigua CBS 183.55 TaxID=1150837 RepID=A0A6A5RL93_9PLEO|nr:uncharacterized protein M421DRAFT_420756 [Didymella exigua CBS 183.55]KAF1928223.1 hypothetical protein M421DRAFT_420756 [Didymella exigua CBS 183.55]
MTPSKRKRKPIRTTTNKWPKYTLPDVGSSSSSEQETADDSEEEWEAVRILEQRGQGFALRYYIEWKGADPATGEQWAPTWERASNASEALRASWRAEQARRAQEQKEVKAAARPGTRQRSAREESPARATQARGARRSRIVESSEHSKSPLDWASPQANIDVRGDSFNRGGYAPFSEIPESQSSPEKSAADSTNLESSPLFESQPAHFVSGIVRETQSSASDVSYIPVTQEELGSSRHSDSSGDSNEDNVIGYSGLLDTDEAPKLGVRAQSPATSIAETVADTTQDIHSQRQFESLQEQSGVPETVESQSPATSYKTDRTRAQNDQSISHRTGPALTQSHNPAEQHLVETPVLFVESSTQSNHEASAPVPERPEQEQNESAAAAQEAPEATPNTQLAASLGGFAVADTPQILQLSTTARKETIQEAQLSSAQQLEAIQLSAQHETEFSLIDRSVWEDNAQFPFQSQCPAFFDPRSVTKPTQRALTKPPRTCGTHENPYTRLSEDLSPSTSQERGPLGDSEESTTIDEINQPPVEGTLRTLPKYHLSSQLAHTQANRQGFEKAVRGSLEYTLNEAEAATTSQPPISTEQSSGSREHNAQVVHFGAYLGTQEQVTGSARETVETNPADAPRSKHSSPYSRHDSSQETPERSLESAEGSASPIPHHPNYSLRTLDSNVPPRSARPLLSSSLSKMAESTSEAPSTQVARRLNEIIAAAERARRRSRASQASVAAFTGAAANDAASQSNNALAPPSVNISAEGTRSPSTVPDQSPALPPSTSLRTVPATTAVTTPLRAVAFYNADTVTEPLMVDSPVVNPRTTDQTPTETNDKLVTAIATAAAHSATAVSSPPAAHDDIENTNDVEDTNDIDDIDDYGDDDEDSYDDELKLDNEEYIVPLYIEGRQQDTYTQYIKQKEELLNEVLVHSPAPVEKLDEVDRALAYLKGVETHPDLTYAEAESATGVGSHSLADVRHGAQFGIDNSVKFKFLGRLFNRLRDKKMHVVLLLDQDNNALSNIIRTFLVAGGYKYKMPTKGYQSMASPDSLFITTFPKAVTPVLPVVDLIICLDGVQNAAQARQRKVPASGKIIPVLHLVIPQTVGHIERYILPTTARRIRIETILAGLAQTQTRNEVGNAIDIDTPSAGEAAQMIACWLFPEEEQESTEWPLPSIGSAKSLIEWDATQQSVRSATSSPVPERTKRPLEEDDLDPAKRMRYTPQPRVIPNSSAVHDPEITRVSDSMPGTAASENARLATSLDKVSTALLQERKERREESIMWDRQQTEHEVRQNQYRKLFNEKAAVDRELATMTANREKIRGQLDVQMAETRGLRDEVEALRVLNLASSDEKNVEITRLRKELEAANLEREKARTSAKLQEETMDFLKEQYRKTQVQATQAQTEVETLTSQNAKLAHQASGEATKLKRMHLDRSMKNLMQQNKALQSENATLKATLKAKEEELVRTKFHSGRAAYGTRGQSTTPQPKTRSRAASPERGSRAPRGGGRILNLVAEER